jgi:hypothetical protein
MRSRSQVDLESASPAFNRTWQSRQQQDVMSRHVHCLEKYIRHMKQACDTHAWAGLSEADGLAEKIAGVIIDA